jgi:ribosomal protein S25
VLQYKEQCQVMESRLFEVNHLANQSQIRLSDTNEVLKSLEERLRTTEVSYFVKTIIYDSVVFPATQEMY